MTSSYITSIETAIRFKSEKKRDLCLIPLLTTAGSGILSSQETEVLFESENKESCLELDCMLHTRENALACSRFKESWKEVAKLRISRLRSLFPILALPPFEVM